MTAEENELKNLYQCLVDIYTPRGYPDNWRSIPKTERMLFWKLKAKMDKKVAKLYSPEMVVKVIKAQSKTITGLWKKIRKLKKEIKNLYTYIGELEEQNEAV